MNKSLPVLICFMSYVSAQRKSNIISKWIILSWLFCLKGRYTPRVNKPFLPETRGGNKTTERPSIVTNLSGSHKEDEDLPHNRVGNRGGNRVGSASVHNIPTKAPPLLKTTPRYETESDRRPHIGAGTIIFPDSGSVGPHSQHEGHHKKESKHKNKTKNKLKGRHDIRFPPSDQFEWASIIFNSPCYIFALISPQMSISNEIALMYTLVTLTSYE